MTSHGSAWKDMPGRPNLAGNSSRGQRFSVQAKSSPGKSACFRAGERSGKVGAGVESGNREIPRVAMAAWARKPLAEQLPLWVWRRGEFMGLTGRRVFRATHTGPDLSHAASLDTREGSRVLRLPNRISHTCGLPAPPIAGNTANPTGGQPDAVRGAAMILIYIDP